MTAVPADRPVTTPRVLTDATAAFVLLQVPPVTMSDNEVVAFWQIVVGDPVTAPVTPVPDSEIVGALLIPAPTNVNEPVDAPPAIGRKRTYTGVDARVLVAETV